MTSPSVLYLPHRAGLAAPYLLYYTAYGPEGIRLAVSTDGIHWQPRGVVLPAGSPGAWDSITTVDPRVLYLGGKFHMLYMGHAEDPRFGSAIGYAVSDDGVNWRRTGRLVVAGSSDPSEFDFGLVQPAPLLEGDKIRIWYTCGPYSGMFGFHPGGIGYAQMPVASLAR
jgi:hypothetical protein